MQVNYNLKFIITAIVVALTLFAGKCDDNSPTSPNIIKTYNLGETGPAGGHICYINPNAATVGWTYLESAPVSTENSALWGAYPYNVGSTDTAIGKGNSNTALIIAKLNDLGETNRAAQYCDILSYNGYDDWFLPSKDELNLLYTNLKSKGIGEFSDVIYYSSSEIDQYYIWIQNFSNGTQNNNFTKGTSARYRAVRTF